MARDVKKDGSGGEGERKRAEEEDVKEIKGDTVLKKKKRSCQQRNAGWEEK